MNVVLVSAGCPLPTSRVEKKVYWNLIKTEKSTPTLLRWNPPELRTMTNREEKFRFRCHPLGMCRHTQTFSHKHTWNPPSPSDPTKVFTLFIGFHWAPLASQLPYLIYLPFRTCPKEGESSQSAIFSSSRLANCEQQQQVLLRGRVQICFLWKTFSQGPSFW